MRDFNYIAELVNRIKQEDDLLAMKVLYNEFAKEMLTTSHRITQNLSDAEDIIQESFLTSFNKINKLKESKNYGAWLKRIVINNSLNLVKKQIHFEEVSSISAASEENEDNWYENIPFDKIKRAINELPDGCRSVFSLYLLENYKHREIANLLNISVSTSKSQYRYALKLMKAALIKYR